MYLHNDYPVPFDKRGSRGLISVHMNAQNIFFILADIFMILAILIQIAVVVLVIAIIVQVRKAEKSIRELKLKAEREMTKLAERKNFLGVIPLIATGIRWLRNRKK